METAALTGRTVELETLTHHFGVGHYIKALPLKRGDVVVQHKHNSDHVSVLVRGTVTLLVGSVATRHVGPCGLLIRAGEHHGIRAETDALWLCVHDTTGLEQKDIDSQLILDGSNSADMKQVAQELTP